MARIGGIRRKSRHKLTKEIREKGKVTITRHFQKFEKGERVKLILEPARQKGEFHPRFQGRSGIIQGMKGNCYEVEIKDLQKHKKLIIHPVHLKRG